MSTNRLGKLIDPEIVHHTDTACLIAFGEGDDRWEEWFPDYCVHPEYSEEGMILQAVYIDEHKLIEKEIEGGWEAI